MTKAAHRIAVSTWSLHRLLGTTYPHDLDSNEVTAMAETYGAGTETLLGLPSVLANHGYNRLEIVSFHLRSRDPIYLAELRDQLDIAKVTLQTLLIDAGDMTDPIHHQRDTNWIAGWVEVANALGAHNARVIAGKQKPRPETLAASLAGFKNLLKANSGETRIVTENWYDLLSTAESVHTLLDRLDGRVGLLADFGNFTGPNKYAELKSIFPRAELCHAKADFIDGVLNQDDYGQCISIAEDARYQGPYTLIFDAREPSEWHGLAKERDFILSRLE
ncbi:sugar phosphate isomerase/epimerase [Devosia sp. WQ 349]|uniref:sugar phosphate isomerase/epimerase family protein n=1 Tax=Devosia sp. WQ 349K1 TaxID=2800329 RepID=UPI001904C8D1|nr:TIM barrel protein [Devosia sp. WQ 349K1]MBK1795969.1 sugar phosphate isomerase/epimerase [Devosia sp. WQ 349K1]